MRRLPALDPHLAQSSALPADVSRKPDRGLTVVAARRTFEEHLETLVEVAWHARDDRRVIDELRRALRAVAEAAAGCGASERAEAAWRIGTSDEIAISRSTHHGQDRIHAVRGIDMPAVSLVAAASERSPDIPRLGSPLRTNRRRPTRRRMSRRRRHRTQVPGTELERRPGGGRFAVLPCGLEAAVTGVPASEVTAQEAQRMHVQDSVEIDRPLHEVFEYVSDVGNYPEWMAHVLDVRKDTPGPPTGSDRFVVAIKSVGRRFETPYERTSYAPERRYLDEAVGGPIPNQRWHSAFHELPGATLLTRGVVVESSGLLKLLEPAQKRAAERQLKKDLRTLKNVMEAP
jgi:uncharacterized membrane protein